MATASLPMYDLPEVRNAHDTLWAVLAQNLRHQGVSNVPDGLAHGQPVATLWNDPELLISQCCGFDIVHGYKNILRPIATPKFAAFGCLGENYCSTIVVPENCLYTDVRDMAGLKILGATYTAPAPPYVVRANLPEEEVTKITDALFETFEEPTIAGHRAQLLLNGLTRAQQEDYWILEAYKDHATKHGFPSLQ